MKTEQTPAPTKVVHDRWVGWLGWVLDGRERMTHGLSWLAGSAYGITFGFCFGGLGNNHLRLVVIVCGLLAGKWLETRCRLKPEHRKSCAPFRTLGTLHDLPAYRSNLSGAVYVQVGPPGWWWHRTRPHCWSAFKPANNQPVGP